MSASVKALTEDPYENIDKKYKVGNFYEGEVTKIMDYGCFVKIEDGIEGLIHNSELIGQIKILNLLLFYLYHKKLNLKL